MYNKITKDRYVMIVGAMKCGTSSLYDYLIQYLEICPCKTKSETYEELFEFNDSLHKYTLEAPTGYTKYQIPNGNECN